MRTWLSCQSSLWRCTWSKYWSGHRCANIVYTAQFHQQPVANLTITIIIYNLHIFTGWLTTIHYKYGGFLKCGHPNKNNYKPTIFWGTSTLENLHMNPLNMAMVTTQSRLSPAYREAAASLDHRAPGRILRAPTGPSITGLGGKKTWGKDGKHMGDSKTPKWMVFSGKKPLTWMILRYSHLWKPTHGDFEEKRWKNNEQAEKQNRKSWLMFATVMPHHKCGETLYSLHCDTVNTVTISISQKNCNRRIIQVVGPPDLP